MTDRVTIRAGRPDDLPQVTRLWCNLVRYHLEQDDRLPGIAPDGAQRWRRRVEKLLKDPSCRLLVAEANDVGRVVGFVTGFLQYGPPMFDPGKTGKVGDVFVEQEWRRRGIGHRLLAGLTGWFRDEQVDYIEVNMVSSNQTAVEFWRTLGAQDLMMQMWMPLDWQDQRKLGESGEEET